MPVAMYMFWQRRWRLALLVAFAPSIAVSYALMRWIDLELYKHSQFGQYLAVYYDPADASAACGGRGDTAARRVVAAPVAPKR
jgi:hypothetical protein